MCSAHGRVEFARVGAVGKAERHFSQMFFSFTQAFTSPPCGKKIFSISPIHCGDRMKSTKHRTLTLWGGVCDFK